MQKNDFLLRIPTEDGDVWINIHNVDYFYANCNKVDCVLYLTGRNDPLEVRMTATTLRDQIREKLNSL